MKNVAWMMVALSLSACGSSSSGTDGSITTPVDAGGTTLSDGGIPSLFRGATATASSVYSSSYAPEMANDGNIDTSWFAESSACSSDGLTCGGLFLQLDNPTAVTATRIALYGNRSSSSGYDVLTGRLILSDAGGSELFATDVVFSRDDGDAVVTPSSPVAGVRRVRLEVRTAESGGPGLAEIAIQ